MQMEAQVIQAFGGPEVFQTLEILRPEPKAGQVLIRVAASSVNPADLGIRSGALQTIAPAFPAILHGDVAGIVDAVGEGVTAFRPGEAVYACAGGVVGSPGALGDYMLADAALVAKKPASLSMVEAGVLPLVSITAWEALVERAQVAPGEKVLIHGGTGGVGHIAIQLAKWLGATVYTTVSSPSKVAIARGLGADVTIDYRTQAVDDYVAEHTGGTGFDVVLDTVGGTNIDASFRAARLNGRVVSLNTFSSHDLSLMHLKGLSLHVVFMLIPLLHGIGRARHGQILAQIGELVDKGLVRPRLDPTSFPFAEVGRAHAYAADRRSVGKIALVR